MAINTIKTLVLTLGAQSVECQLTRAALIDSPTTEELTTFCGVETSSIPNYQLELAGFQDYGVAQSVFDLIHTAYVTNPVASLAFKISVGGKSRSGNAKPINDVPFGGDAGAALTGDITLDVIGAVVDGVATVTGTAGTPGSWTGTPVPATSAAATSAGVTASPATAWTTGQYIQGSTAGSTGEMYWSGTAWTAGRKP
jgi:hypothetical protein